MSPLARKGERAGGIAHRSFKLPGTAYSRRAGRVDPVQVHRSFIHSRLRPPGAFFEGRASRYPRPKPLLRISLRGRFVVGIVMRRFGDRDDSRAKFLEPILLGRDPGAERSACATRPGRRASAWERAIISRAPLKWALTGFEKLRFNETIARTSAPVRLLGRQAFPFMRTEKARISPFLAAAYPLKARTPFNTPVFTRTRRESTPRRRLFFTVPSTPNTASDAMNSGRSLKSLCAASSRTARERGEARFILLRPEPSARAISFAETPAGDQEIPHDAQILFPQCPARRVFRSPSS